MIVGEIARLLSSPGTTTDRVDPWVDAACRAYPAALGLWDDASLHNAGPELAIAVPVCHACPIRQACEDIATASEAADPTGGAHGVWGGRSPVERHGRNLRYATSSRGTARDCSVQDCGQPSWGAARSTAPQLCAEHLIAHRRWSVVDPRDLPDAIYERAAKRAYNDGEHPRTTWSQRRSAERQARREAAAAIPGQRRAAESLVEDAR